ncbi:MAG: 16S rRNA (guanine(527)-N(7))-methyltransferase RsmG [Bdellovibrio sp.]|jgi:16S rRNA (guanine527-N7)-methyltransferase
MAHKNRTNISPLKSHQGKTHKKPLQIFNAFEAEDRLRDLFQNHGMGHITPDQRKALAAFYVLLMENQKTENFTRLLSLKDVGIRHYVDCLIVAQLTTLKFPLVDVGTGPGFPGIPLKILFPNQKIILAEGVQRRVEFLKQVRQSLALPNLDIIGRNINPWFMYPVQGVITRAVEDVRNTLQNVLSCVQMGGRVYLMKGPNVDPEIKVAQAEVGEFYKLVEDHAYLLPQTSHERRLLVFEKIKHAPLPSIDDEPWPQDELFDNQNLKFKKSTS